MESPKPEKVTTQTRSAVSDGRPLLSSISTARIETLTDGVFAIVMTILVFNFHIPTQAEVAEHGLLRALALQTPTLLGYAITFVILGVLWVGHHNQFFYIRRADRVLLWINIFFMMTVALLPFSAELFSEYGQDQTAIILYNLNLILAEIMLFIHWWYATRDSHLLNHIIEPQARTSVSRRILTPPIFYLIAIGISIFSVDMSIFIDILVPIVYVLPNRIDHLFRRG
ncbi:MAG TPA: TMEM175 family protein [Phototrophicaceae bacterium]|nr:TMEM175 family protein [Phototrophicaceae bacterium]